MPAKRWRRPWCCLFEKPKMIQAKGMHPMKRLILIVAGAAALAVMEVAAKPVPATPFADNMVLQRGRQVPVWGTAKQDVARYWRGWCRGNKERSCRRGVVCEWAEQHGVSDMGRGDALSRRERRDDDCHDAASVHSLCQESSQMVCRATTWMEGGMAGLLARIFRRCSERFAGCGRVLLCA